MKKNPLKQNATKPNREKYFMVRAEDELHDGVKKLAKKEGLSMNELILRVLRGVVKKAA